jgi:hypothetical protein
MGFYSICGLISVVTIASLYTLCSHDLEWDKLSVSDIGASKVVANDTLLKFRILCAVVIWSLNAYLLLDREGLAMLFKDRDGRNKVIKLIGLPRFSMCTLWCWTLEGLYFVLAAVCSYLTVNGSILPSYYQLLLARISWVLFEVRVDEKTL